MKIKQYIVITSPHRFLRGDYESSISVFGSPWKGDGSWINCGDVTLEIDVDAAILINSTVSAIDREIEREKSAFHEAISILEAKKSELLALPNMGDV